MIEAVEIVRRADLRGLKDLAERRCEILGVARSAIIDQHTIAGVGVGCGVAEGHAAQRVVAVRCGAIVRQVAGRVVAEAINLVSGVEGLGQRVRAVEPHTTQPL